MKNNLIKVEPEEGERYPIHTPCSSTCKYTPAECSFLGIKPYSYVFKAPVKGRWLDLSLLELFVREFAYIPAPKDDDDDEAGHGETVATAPLSFDYRTNLCAYIEELEEGYLWLQNREAECRQCGQYYHDALCTAYARTTAASDLPPAEQWRRVKAWVLTVIPNDADYVGDLLKGKKGAECGIHFEPKLCLRQKDTILHRVWRREGRIFAQDPIDILYCGLSARQQPGAAQQAPLSLMVVRKPAGMPVHPSGSYRKNTVTSMLEDIFGGCDRNQYTFVEKKQTRVSSGKKTSKEETFMSIYHKKYGFEVVRVFMRCTEDDVRTNSGSEDYSSGVAAEDWALLRQYLTADPDTSPPASSADKKRPRGEEGTGTSLKLYVVHRLDAATSGVLLFGLSSDVARTATMALSHKEERTTSGEPYADEGDHSSKCYLALVKGRLEVRALAAEVGCALVRDDGERADDGASLLIDRPIGCISYHDSTYGCPGAAEMRRWVAEKAVTPAVVSSPVLKEETAAAALAAKHSRMKEITRGSKPQVSAGSSDRSEAFLDSLKVAKTICTPLSYNAQADETLVKCRLQTGRTHQLRVHLCSIGFPIVGDRKYIKFLELTQTLGREPGSADTGDSPFARLLKRWNEIKETNDRVLCQCPERICLHAWSYALHLGDHPCDVWVKADPPQWFSL